MNDFLLKEKLTHFLIEDVGAKDVTAETIFSLDEHRTAIFYAKEEGILSGVNVIQATYGIIDSSIIVNTLKCDGEKVNIGEKIAEVSGPIRHILMGERIILNLIQRMSGIATQTALAVKRLNDPNTRICDTRKTTPGLRMFEKYAVTCGGGYNHRNGLYDGVMMKDNHIVACGSITNAVRKVRNKLGPMIKIEVETETKDQVIEAVEANCDIIMFDNRTPKEIATFIELVPDYIITEASGGITLETLPTYRNLGIDYISLGFLTHSVKSLDISLMIEGGY